jgi:hypothetical protein
MSDTLLERQSWCHRKVESLVLLEGAHGRRRISLDCTPPPEPGLAYEPDERGCATIDDVGGLVMVPLALIKKGPMRALDVLDGAGRSIPVLGRLQDGEVAVAVLRHLLSRNADLSDEAIAGLTEVVLSPAPEAMAAVDRLLSTGTNASGGTLDPAAVDSVTTGFLSDLANNFLLVCLLPAEVVGLRQVLKFSFHWRAEAVGTPQRAGIWSRTLTAFGYAPVALQVPVPGAVDAASYHLEVHAPEGLVCTKVDLPAGGSFAQSLPVDEPDSVGHAHDSYPEDEPPEDPAYCWLAVPRSGLRFTSLLMTSFTALVFLLAQLLPGGRDALADAPDGATAVLLALPAVALALLARPSENELASYLLLPVRLAVITCSALLVAGAASLVGELHAPYVVILWWVSAAVATLLAVMLGVAFALRRP